MVMKYRNKESIQARIERKNIIRLTDSSVDILTFLDRVCCKPGSYHLVALKSTKHSMKDRIAFTLYDKTEMFLCNQVIIREKPLNQE